MKYNDYNPTNAVTAAPKLTKITFPSAAGPDTGIQRVRLYW